MRLGSTHIWVLAGLAGMGGLEGTCWASPLDCGPIQVSAGIVPQGKVVHLERTCRNHGASEVTLSPPVTGCTCLSAQFANKRVAPGGETRLRLALETAPLGDRVEFSVDFTTRSKDTTRQMLVVTADVRPSVIALPQYVDMGDFRRQGTRQVLILDTTGRSFDIEQAVSERSAVDVRWTRVELVRMGSKWELSNTRGAVTGFQITLQAHPGSVRQSLSDEIVLDLNHELQKTLRLRVVGYSPTLP
ncbi:MAG TPA: hypothetical protein PKO15_01750 [Fibrobacteria bacterium]|nr:hypothetical protein [Fibrobacteria bacterium]HOX49843.1 hypothetical protein [Fibrobacteria bacterium]